MYMQKKEGVKCQKNKYFYQYPAFFGGMFRFSHFLDGYFAF